MQQLSNLLYISSGPEKLSNQELVQLLEQSRMNNQLNNITGVLCAGGGHFIQVLEGDERDLIKLYAKILDDPRHHDVALIGIAPISARMFKDWSMAYIEKSAVAMHLRRDQLLSYRNHHGHGVELVRVMQRLLEMLKYEV